MNDEASTLRAVWMSEAAPLEDDLQNTIDRILVADRADRARERRLRIGGIVALLPFVPVLIWATAHGVAPLVRGAYALMAAGCVAMVVVEWLYLGWSRRGSPGPADTRTQLQKTVFMLEYQLWLARTAVAWSSPVFVGVVLISAWLYRERTAAAAMTVLGLNIAAWIGSGVLTSRAAKELGRRKQQLEDVLAGL